MNFSLKDSVDLLSRTPKVLHSMLLGLPDPWVHNDEGEDSWSPFDVVGHLIHGEKTDWIPRTKIILHEEEKHFERFDRFAQYEVSKGKSLDELLEEFKKLRSDNLDALKSLDLNNSDYDKIGIHPEFGTVNLRQLLSTWVAHDLGHIYQISRVLAKNYSNEVGPWKKYLRVLKE